ncbi:FAD synthetase family protein [Treponema sp. OMZ 791]|uniref:FAD synthetase family protein n=1 Tax=unclassified Treponema TaxID=2638727 RepID=UPI0021FBC736|nr:FAD synthetase family protein [Treponema sp. OMZ 789]UTC71153.1 FAD synthetase family protein [Treponema sp. OMZ 790]UTC73864.1 FAD synthetase family protein [Treponema sp. OMZ 791]
MDEFKIISWEELVESGSHVFPEGKETAISVGGFDGPHKGHDKLLRRVLGYAAENALIPGLVTFFRSPAAVKNKPYSGDVSSLRLRLKKFQELGFHFIVLIDFSAGFAKIEGTVFFDIIIKTIRMKYLAVGSDFLCGYRRGLGAEDLKKIAPQKGFCFDSIDPVNVNGSVKVSSSAIRTAVGLGDFSLAKDLLGYPFLFDFISLPWEVKDKNNIFAPKAYITQILPQSGKYRVLIKKVDGQKQEAHCFISEEGLLLCFTEKTSKAFDLKDLDNFDTIEFICKE